MTTKTKTAWKWEQGTRLEQGGHRVVRDGRNDFQAPELRGWAIADNSGGAPHTTDDGVLWLDFARPLRVEIGYEKSQYGLITATPRVLIPLRVDRDGESHTSTSIMDGFATLRRLFPRWSVEYSEGAQTFLRAALGASEWRLGDPHDLGPAQPAWDNTRPA
jgi:hypothetical protein